MARLLPQSETGQAPSLREIDAAQTQSPKIPTSSPAQPNCYWKDASLAVAVISAMVAAFDEDLGIVEAAQTIGNSSAEVEAARVLGKRGQRLLALKRAVGAVNAPPAIPYLWAYLGRREHLAGRRNAAPIETYAENSICPQFAVMTRHGNDAVEAYRLHISAGAIYVRTLAHAGSQAQVVVHVFRIHPEHAAEVHSASDHPLIGVADKAADLAAAKAKSAADGKVKTIEI